MTQHLHVELAIPIFGCAVRFNSCENQPRFSWLIVELFSLFQVKIGLIRNLLFGVYSILLGCYVLWPSLKLFVIKCGLCSWKNIHRGHRWHSILKYNYCTACANTVHASKLGVYNPDKPGVCKMPCFSACFAMDNIPNQPLLWEVAKRSTLHFYRSL